jgi:hypothetical protein
MPSIEHIQLYMTAVWRMMTGRADGLRMLDLSVDGFWNSFFAIPVALPPLVVGWVGVVNDLGPDAAGLGGRLSVLLRLAAIDFACWVVPLAGLAAVAVQVRIGDRFVHYVVASNWGSALIAWLMLPPALLKLLAPSQVEMVSLFSLAMFVASAVLTWRLTNVALGKGAVVASATFAGMFFASLAIFFILQAALGLSDQFPG